MERAKLDAIMAKINSCLNETSYRCIECEWEKADRILRAYFDHPEGMDLTRCVEVTHMLGDAVFIDELVSGQYTLEISSPGIERPLRAFEDFAANLGKKIELIQEKSVVGGKRRMKGRLLSVNSDVLEIKVAGNLRSIPLDSLQKARILNE